MPFLDLWLKKLALHSVADPGFPRGGGAKPRGGAPTYYLANFSRKLHENEEISGQRGVGASLEPLLRSATGICLQVLFEQLNEIMN